MYSLKYIDNYKVHSQRKVLVIFVVITAVLNLPLKICMSIIFCPSVNISINMEIFETHNITRMFIYPLLFDRVIIPLLIRHAKIFIHNKVQINSFEYSCCRMQKRFNRMSIISVFKLLGEVIFCSSFVLFNSDIIDSIVFWVVLVLHIDLESKVRSLAPWSSWYYIEALTFNKWFIIHSRP